MHGLDTFREHLSFTSPPDARRHLLDTLVPRYGYEGGLLRVAYMHDRGKRAKQFLAAALWLEPRKRTARAPLLYPLLELSERWVPSEELRELIGVNDNHVELRDSIATVSFTSSSAELVATADALTTLSRSAETIITFDSHERQLNIPHWPAVGNIGPVFMTIAEAVAAWCSRRRANYANDVRERGRLSIIAPETRARIRDMWVEEDIFFAKLVALPTIKTTTHILFSDTNGARLSGTSSRRRRVRAQVPRNAQRVDVFVVDEHGELITHARNWLSYLRRDLTSQASRRAEDELADGENETVEFKVWPNKGDGKKVQEVVHSVVAFANTRGGRVYVGVDDAGVPQGLGPIHNLGSTPDEILKTVMAQVDREIRNLVRPVPEYAVSDCLASGRTIVVVDVAAGDQRPYATEQNDVYVRRGATNRKADPQTEMPQLYSSRTDIRQ